MEKNYNFERKKLMLPEYGRHIHQMVDYLCTIEDRTVRNEQAHVVVEVMGNINPVLRDAADFKHKLWDHLFIMSDFMLDVDSPYPMPDRQTLHPKPDKIEYPSKRIVHKHYGKNIERMLSALKDIPNEQARKAIASNIAKYMRTKSFEYNQEYPNNDIILKDIRKMSEGAVELTEDNINSGRTEYKQPKQTIEPVRVFRRVTAPISKTTARPTNRGASAGKTGPNINSGGRHFNLFY